MHIFLNKKTHTEVPVLTIRIIHINISIMRHYTYRFPVMNHNRYSIKTSRKIVLRSQRLTL